MTYGTLQAIARCASLLTYKSAVQFGFSGMRSKAKVATIFTFTCAAYNLVRLRRLLAEPSPA